MAEEESGASLGTSQVVIIVCCAIALVLLAAVTKYICTYRIEASVTQQELTAEMKRDEQREADLEAAREEGEMPRKLSTASRGGRPPTDDASDSTDTPRSGTRMSSRSAVWGTGAGKAAKRSHSEKPRRSSKGESPENNKMRRSRSSGHGTRHEETAPRASARNVAGGHMSGAGGRGLGDMADEFAAGNSFARAESMRDSQEASDSRLRALAELAAGDGEPQWRGEQSSLSDQPSLHTYPGIPFGSTAAQQKRIVGELLSDQALHHHKANAWSQPPGPQRLLPHSRRSSTSSTRTLTPRGSRSPSLALEQHVGAASQSMACAFTHPAGGASSRWAVEQPVGRMSSLSSTTSAAPPPPRMSRRISSARVVPIAKAHASGLNLLAREGVDVV